MFAATLNPGSDPADKPSVTPEQILAGKKILLIDDEVHVVSVLTVAFQKAGAVVITSDEGGEGYRKAVFERPDLVVVDYQIPGMDGLELANKLGGNHLTSNIPILLLTARGHSLNVDQVTGAGMHHVFSKPFSPRQVLAVAAQMISPAATAEGTPPAAA